MYWKVIYGHRNGSEEDWGFFGVPGGYWNSLGKLLGLIGHRGGEEAGHKRCGTPPLPQSELDKGRGCGPPLSFSLSLLSHFPLSVGRKGGPNPTRFGVLVGLPAWCTSSLAGLPLLYIHGKRAPQRHNINCLSRVQCPPPQFTTLVILS